MASITETIIKMPDYFRRKGYEIYDNFIFDFFSYSLVSDNIEDLEAVIKPIFLKNKTDYFTFHSDFVKFLENVDSFVVNEDQVEELKLKIKKRELIEKEIKKYTKSSKDRREKIDNFNKNHLYSEKELAKLDKLYNKIKKEYETITKNSLLYDIFRKRKLDKKAVNEELKIIAQKALEYDNFKDILNFVEKQKKHIDSIKEFNLEAEKKKAEEEEKKREELQQLLDKTAKEFKTIVKAVPSIKHRKIFIGKNAVQSEFNEKIFNEKLSHLQDKDIRQIEEYIKENAKKFRTKLANKIKTNHKTRLDITETCKEACKTNGVPMKLCFNKPKKEKSKLVMFLDISGSCSCASKMLLTFMHQMKSVFPNGCEIFVFVNSLYDVSELFVESDSSEEFIDNVLNIVPVKGVYSDYYSPLETFYKQYFYKLTKDSIVFFMGDARNNKNETGEDYIKAIARKSKKSYWLNTEEVDKWDTGDSIMSIYGQYMSDVQAILTVKDLLAFLTEV